MRRKREKYHESESACQILFENLYDKVKSHIDAVSGEDVFYDILFDSYVEYRLTDVVYVNYYKAIFEW